MSELKIENINKVNAVNAPANAVEIKEQTENTLEDTAKSTAFAGALTALTLFIFSIFNSLMTSSSIF